MFGHRYFGAAYFGPRYWGPAGAPDPVGTPPTYGGDGFSIGDLKRLRERGRAHDKRLRKIRAKRDEERAQLAKDLRAVIRATDKVEDAPQQLPEIKQLARAPQLSLLPIMGLLQDLQQTLMAYSDAQSRAAVKQALEAEQRATLIAAYERTIADMVAEQEAAERDDEEALMMIIRVMQ